MQLKTDKVVAVPIPAAAAVLQGPEQLACLLASCFPF